MHSLKWCLIPLALGGSTACIVPVHGRHGRVAVIAPLPSLQFTYVQREPPPPRYEPPPPPPSSEHYWVEGHWAWQVDAYVWVPGTHYMRPHRGGVWVPGGWERHHRGWHWREGRWR